jgi:hypothetical protein
MTSGGINRRLLELTGRVTRIEGAKNGSAFTDKQTEQINEISASQAKTYADRAFNHLIFWCALAAFSGGASVVFAYLKIGGKL